MAIEIMREANRYVRRNKKGIPTYNKSESRPAVSQGQHNKWRYHLRHDDHRHNSPKRLFKHKQFKHQNRGLLQPTFLPCYLLIRQEARQSSHKHKHVNQKQARTVPWTASLSGAAVAGPFSSCIAHRPCVSV